MQIQLSKLVEKLTTSIIPTKNLTTQSMSNAWTVKEIIPEVLPEVPSRKLGIQYPDVTINEGTVVRPTQVKNPPDVFWTAKDPSAMSAILMMDPDAPSKKEPTLRNWKHWLVVNIPGNSLPDGDTIAAYVGAGPPKDTGMHRYIFLLFTYPQKITITAKRMDNRSTRGRANLNVQNFIKKYDIGAPVAGNFFMAEYDDYVPQLLDQLGIK